MFLVSTSPVPEAVVSDLLNRKEVVSSWQPWGLGLDDDLDCGPSPSRVIASGESG